jgi:glycine dehydrogenase subunit 1
MGIDTIDDLFATIPRESRLTEKLDLPPPMDEAACREHLGSLSVANRALACTPAFVGCGAYRHEVPAAVDALLSRGEFFTAYTPYQPEVSQGTLQGAYEFQTMVAELTGLDVANASMYDGATSCAEAALMMRRVKRRNKPSKVLVSEGVHPEYVETMRTFVRGVEGLEVEEVRLSEDGKTSRRALRDQLDDQVAGVVCQSPNCLGVIEEVESIAAEADGAGALTCCAVAELTSLGILKPPGEAGCQLAVGDGLGLTGPVYYGGPGVGFISCRDKVKRNLPGRLIGETVDEEGRRGYVLTLATREQHIRREKATSNICTNQALMALALAIHLSLLGRTGFAELARINFSRAQHLKARLSSAGLLAHPESAHYNEMAVRVTSGDADSVVKKILEEHNVLAGVALGRFKREWKDLLLVNVTERNTKEQMDELVEALQAYAC